MLRCEASLHARSDKDTEYDFVFNLNTRRGCVASSSTQPRVVGHTALPHESATIVRFWHI
jgi:hypothetical protein